MSETKHTPTPWEAVQHSDGRHWFVEYTQGGERHTLLDELDEATVKFIVRACNAHDELVDALEEAVTCFDDTRDPDVLQKDGDPIQSWKETIAKAKRKEA